MTVSIRYLWPRPGTESLWFKRKVPKDLVSAVGKTWIQFSLKTTDAKTAARLIDKYATEQDRLWNELRAISSGNLSKASSVNQGRHILQSNGIDPADLRADPFALELFFDAVEEQLPIKVRDKFDEATQLGIPVTPRDIEKHLPPATAAAFAMAQGRMGHLPEHLASDCMREYIAARTDDPQSVKSAKIPFEYLIKLIGDKPLSKYRRLDVRKFVDHLLAGDHSPTGKAIATTTIGRYVTTLRAAFALSIKEHELGITNVWQGTIEFPKGAKGAEKRETFNVDQYRHLYRAINQHNVTHGPDQLRCILTLVAETGARLAEIVGLASADVHLSAAVPYLDIQKHPWRTIKADVSTRKTPLTSKAQDAVQEALRLADRSPFLFPKYTSADKCKAGTASAALVKWVRTCEGLTGTKLGNHSLRHGMEDLLRAIGCPDSVRDQITGHKTPGMGANYGRGYPLDMLADWLSKATEAVR